MFGHVRLVNRYSCVTGVKFLLLCVQAVQAVLDPVTLVTAVTIYTVHHPRRLNHQQHHSQGLKRRMGLFL
jgi:hypothetical protein